MSLEIEVTDSKYIKKLTFTSHKDCVVEFFPEKAHDAKIILGLKIYENQRERNRCEVTITHEEGKAKFEGYYHETLDFLRKYNFISGDTSRQASVQAQILNKENKVPAEMYRQFIDRRRGEKQAEERGDRYRSSFRA